MSIFLSPVYSHACAVWSLPVHGSVLSPRHPGEPSFGSIDHFELLMEKTGLLSCVFASAQFFDRLRLFSMPAKHQPDFIYLRHVPLRKVHLFTIIQLSCLVLLWVIKTSKAAIVFPMMVKAVNVCVSLLFTSVLTAFDWSPCVSAASGLGSGVHS